MESYEFPSVDILPILFYACASKIRHLLYIIHLILKQLSSNDLTGTLPAQADEQHYPDFVPHPYLNILWNLT